MKTETLLRTREHFAEIARGCIDEVQDGRVKLAAHVSPAAYFAECKQRAEEYRAGKWDHTLTFKQRAEWFETGVMRALLP